MRLDTLKEGDKVIYAGAFVGTVTVPHTEKTMGCLVIDYDMLENKELEVKMLKNFRSDSVSCQRLIQPYNKALGVASKEEDNDFLGWT